MVVWGGVEGEKSVCGEVRVGASKVRVGNERMFARDMMKSFGALA